MKALNGVECLQVATILKESEHLKVLRLALCARLTAAILASVLRDGWVHVCLTYADVC